MVLLFSVARMHRALMLITLAGLLAVVPVAQALTEQKLEASTQAAIHDLEDAVTKVQPLVEKYGYPGVFTVVAVEGFGVPAPGQTLLMAGALEAADGHLNIALLLGLAVLGAVLGNSLGYLIGKTGGRKLLRKLHVDEAREAQIEGLFQRYGGAIILLARFFDGPRQINGIVAGTLGMGWWTFTAFNVAGALLWVGVWGFGTYYLTEHLHAVDAFIRQLNPWVSGIVVIGVLAAVIYLLKGRRGTPSQSGRNGK